MALVLHWAAPHDVDPDDGVIGLGDGELGVSVLHRSSQPLSLARNIPRSVGSELRLSTVADQSGLPSSSPPAAIARVLVQRPATPPTPYRVVELTGPPSAFIRNYRSRAPPDRPIA